MRALVILVAAASLLGVSCAPSSGNVGMAATAQKPSSLRTDSSSAAPSPPGSPSSRVTVYYFHRTLRCVACLEMEALTRQAMEYFAREQDEGTVVLRVVNVEEEENEHFVEDFGVSFNTIVLVREEGGQVTWEDLGERAWDLQPYPEEFIPFLVNEVAGYLATG